MAMLAALPRTIAKTMYRRVDNAMKWIARGLAGLVLGLAISATALAQTGLEGADLDVFSPDLPASKQDFGRAPIGEALSLPIPYSAVPDSSAPLANRKQLVLEAKLTADGAAIGDGITWRVFGSQPGVDGELPLVASTKGGTASLELDPGDYIVHAAFGRAGAMKRVALKDARHVESLVFNAGGIKLDAVVGDGRPVEANQVSFEITQEGEGAQRIVVVPNAAAGKVVRLAAGTYHVISRYGSVNAVVRADIEVESGKLTEATIRHAGAAVTLKLVSEAGGEALANTSWTVLNEGGDTVNESVGAFPTMILAEGKYTAVANHKGEPYASDFNVEPGRDRDVEVLLSDKLRQEHRVR